MKIHIKCYGKHKMHLFLCMYVHIYIYIYALCKSDNVPLKTAGKRWPRSWSCSKPIKPMTNSFIIRLFLRTNITWCAHILMRASVDNLNTLTLCKRKYGKMACRVITSLLGCIRRQFIKYICMEWGGRSGSMNMLVYVWGLKVPKNCLRTLWMIPRNHSKD